MWALAPALLLGRAIEVQTPQHEPESEPSWAFPVRDQALAEADDSELKHVPGSSKAYTQRQIDDSSSPPDWFPDEHAPMSEVVKHGSGKSVPACAMCHLASGLGHPESANLTGLSVSYLVRQLAEFRSGARSRMVTPNRSVIESSYCQRTFREH
jgi:hypothetical protein